MIPIMQYITSLTGDTLEVWYNILYVIFTKCLD